ncbi:MAG: hypothetical protein KA715_09790 [Xanthomonadaceae bacterium]|nr:hypothetical protein [Xanthomonadaceae bacterium]
MNAALLIHSILLLGDSHLVGPMGHELVKLLDVKKVSINASCGSTPATFFSGIGSPCGTWRKIEGLPTVETSKPFSETTLLSESLNRVSPHHIIVSLGTNLATRCTKRKIRCYSDKEVLTQIEKFLTLIRERQIKCSWILSPPVTALRKEDVTHVNEIIRDAVTKTCNTIDAGAEGHTYPKKGGDGLHYFGTEAKKWAEIIFKNI